MWIAEKAAAPDMIDVFGRYRSYGVPGESVMVAHAVNEGFAWLAAVTVTVWVAETVAGAVYRPEEEMVPNCGLSDQSTALLDWFVTVAVNCWVWPAVRVPEGGEREMFPVATLTTPSSNE